MLIDPLAMFTGRTGIPASFLSSSFRAAWSRGYKTFFLLSLTMRPNKLEHLSLETLSSQVLEFEGKARVNPIGGTFQMLLG
jgi:hypothetical protein